MSDRWTTPGEEHAYSTGYVEGRADGEDNLTRFAQEVWAKSCYITDAEGLQHEVIHTGDLQDLIREWLGWAD